MRQQPNGLRYLRWGGTGEPRPTRKMKRRRKLLGMCAESPASGARFVGRFFYLLSDSLAFTRRSAKNLGNDPGDFGCFSNRSKISTSSLYRFSL